MPLQTDAMRTAPAIKLLCRLQLKSDSCDNHNASLQVLLEEAAIALQPPQSTTSTPLIGSPSLP